MRRFTECLPAALLCFIWISWAYAAGPTGKSAQTPPPTASQEAPSIQVPSPTHDFGEVPEGAEVTHDFVIKNTGKAPLEIQQVKPG